MTPLKARTLSLCLAIAGLLPQLLAVIEGVRTPNSMMAVSIGYAYAALIFSFLGGLWWGVAINQEGAPRWLFIVSVLPSLIAFGTAIIMAIGAASGFKSGLIAIGIGILISPIVDYRIKRLDLIDKRFLLLRLYLSLGLGALTLTLAGIAS